MGEGSWRASARAPFSSSKSNELRESIVGVARPDELGGEYVIMFVI